MPHLLIISTMPCKVQCQAPLPRTRQMLGCLPAPLCSRATRAPKPPFIIDSSALTAGIYLKSMTLDHLMLSTPAQKHAICPYVLIVQAF